MRTARFYNCCSMAVSVMFTCIVLFVWLIAMANDMVNEIINTILIITAHVAYVLPMRLMKSFGLIYIVQIENSIADANVNSTDEKPKNMPDAATVMQNANAIATGLAIMASVNLLYHLDLISICVADFLSSIKYPGTHVMPKPNGMLQTIFHVGMPIVCARRSFA